MVKPAIVAKMMGRIDVLLNFIEVIEKKVFVDFTLSFMGHGHSLEAGKAF
jgi:hypothetical protein